MKNYMLMLIFVSIFLGITGGIFYPDAMLSMSWIGVVFMNLLKLVVLPLVFSALVSSIASMGNLRKLGSVGVYTLIFVFSSVAIAVLIGLSLINFFQPGLGVDPNLIPLQTDINEKPLAFTSFILNLFPANIVVAAVKFEMMAIVFFSVVFALACIAVGDESKPVISFFIGLRSIFIKMISWLMYLTPLGLFALLGTAIAEAEKQHHLVQSILGMLMFLVVFISALFLQVTWQFVLLKVVAKRNPFQYLRAASPALATAFGTSSSMATLPITLTITQEQGISPEVSRFVLPFATTINLAGTAMYEAVSALFFCQVLGIKLSIISQLGLFITAIVAGMGATGIPEGGLVTMVTVLRATNVPTSAIALLLPFDRILDRFRTMVNIWGDLVCAATVDYFLTKKKKATNKNTALEKSGEVTAINVD